MCFYCVPVAVNGFRSSYEEENGACQATIKFPAYVGSPPSFMSNAVARCRDTEIAFRIESLQMDYALKSNISQTKLLFPR